MKFFYLEYLKDNSKGENKRTEFLNPVYYFPDEPANEMMQTIQTSAIWQKGQRGEFDFP